MPHDCEPPVAGQAMGARRARLGWPRSPGVLIGIALATVACTQTTPYRTATLAGTGTPPNVAIQEIDCSVEPNGRFPRCEPPSDEEARQPPIGQHAVQRRHYVYMAAPVAGGGHTTCRAVVAELRTRVVAGAWLRRDSSGEPSGTRTQDSRPHPVSDRRPSQGVRVQDRRLRQRVEPGKLADLIAVTANPLEDIAHLRRLGRVVVDRRQEQ